MVDENTQTDGSIESANIPLKVTENFELAKTAQSIWIPLEKSQESIDKSTLRNTTTIKHDKVLKTTQFVKNTLIVEEYKLQNDQIKKTEDCNLLDICSRFLSSPVLQILDLSVLDFDQEPS